MNLRIYRTVELIHEGKVVCTLHDLLYPEEATRDLGEIICDWRERITRRRNISYNYDLRTTWKPVHVSDAVMAKHTIREVLTAAVEQGEVARG